MANHGQQLCLATPLGEPCANPRQTQHPYLLEIPSCCCFGCKELVMVTREAARLSTKGVPLVSVDRVKSKFQIVGSGYQHPAGSVGGLARETLCALCTQPANGDGLECFGSRDGTACKLVWHASCHVATSDVPVPSHGGVFRCCTGWPDRAKLDDAKDRFREPHTYYRKRLAKPGSLGSTSVARGGAANASIAAVDDASTAAAANASVLDVAAQPPATPAPSSSGSRPPPTMVHMVRLTSLLTPHTSPRAEPAESNDVDKRTPSGPTGKPRRSLSNQTEDAAAIGGAVGGAGAGASAGAGTGSVAGAGAGAGAGAAVLGTARLPSQCETHPQCIRGFRHGGKGGKCSLRPRLLAAADASSAPVSKGRPPADVGGINWKNTAVDASRILDESGAQCDVFEATVSADPSGTFGHVWRGKEKPLPRHLWPKEKLELAVKTPKSVTEPAGDNESAMKKRAEADMRLHWEARATPSLAHTQHRYRCRVVVRRHTPTAVQHWPLHPTPDMVGTHPRAAAATRRAQRCAAAWV